MHATSHQFRNALTTWLVVSLCACGTADLASSEALPAVAGVSLAAADAAPGQALDDANLPSLGADTAALAADLYRLIGAPSGNMVFSPQAVAMALGMVSMGAHGQTSEQMRAILHWNDTTDDLTAHVAAWRDALAASASEPVSLGAANAVWGVPELSPTPAYAAALADGFGSTWHSINIAVAPDAAREGINAWVNTQTQGLIPELLGTGQLPSTSRMIVTSALSMAAPWQRPFSPQATSNQAFYRDNGQKSVVPMMGQRLTAGFAATDAFEAVDLPYAGGSLRFTVLLPTGTHTLTQALSAQPLMATFAALKPRTVQLTLPRFSISASYSLRETLQALGMRDAFDPTTADFAAINGAGGLVLDDLVHQTVIEVDEAGTRAAAATGATMRPTAVPANVVTVNVNRPFLFAIRDTGSQSLLFLGRVEQP